MKTIKVRTDDFCQWYFDKDQLEEMKDECFNTLMTGEIYTLDLDNIYERLGYIPIRLVINKEDVDKKDIEDDEIFEPMGLYKVEWIKWNGLK